MGDEHTVDLRPGRAVIGYVGLVGSAFYVWTTLREYPVGTMERPGAAVFPLLVGTGLAVASLMVIVESHAKTGRTKPLDMDWRGVLRAAAVLGILVVYLAVMPTLGFVLATIGFLLATFRVLTEASWVRVATAAVLTSVAFYGLFAVLFAVPLPIGALNVG